MEFRKTHDIGLEKLRKNIKNIIKEIPKSTYKKLFKGSYERSKNMYLENLVLNLLKIINKSRRFKC
jgi:predicted component of viral defense system (DUF524 family)